MPKKITVKCYGPIGHNKTYQSPWEDVWLSWTGKPGRKKYYLAPTLCSKTSTIYDQEINIECKKRNPNIDFDDDIKETQKAIDSINNGIIYIDNPKSKLPNISSPKDYIDRAEAERMIAEVMKLHGYDSIICKWRRPKFVIIPI